MEMFKVRNKTNSFIYEKVLKPVFFQFDPEFMHKKFIKIGAMLGNYKLTKKITRDMFHYSNPMLKQKILGMEFKNPVGLSAGFDKNAEIISICEDVGFGFSEVGSLTKLQCSGNSGKRLKRMIKQKSIWVNLGLNNNGADEISKRLKNKKYKMPMGVSIAKTNCSETVNDKIGIEDYAYTLKKFNQMGIGNFYVLNVSCPNAYGGQPFSDKKRYSALLKEIAKLRVKKPIFVKLSPDLTKKELDNILLVSKKYRIAGFTISNLTKKHNLGKGGLSGKAVEKEGEKMLRYIYSKTKGKYILIGVGGIFSAEDAYRKIRAGANLVELITGMIYRGPSLIGEINFNLAEILKRDGFSNVKEAVGVDVKPVSHKGY